MERLKRADGNSLRMESDAVGLGLVTEDSLIGSTILGEDNGMVLCAFEGTALISSEGGIVLEGEL